MRQTTSTLRKIEGFVARKLIEPQTSPQRVITISFRYMISGVNIILQIYISSLWSTGISTYVQTQPRPFYGQVGAERPLKGSENPGATLDKL